MGLQTFGQKEDASARWSRKSGTHVHVPTYMYLRRPNHLDHDVSRWKSSVLLSLGGTRLGDPDLIHRTAETAWTGHLEYRGDGDSPMARLDLIAGVMCLCLLTAAGGEGLWCMRTWPDNTYTYYSQQ
jgi:hypothetical protein